MAELTPMMQQYMQIKEENKDCILFYRLGDFYEMFFDDALTASKELEITLTGKNCGLEERAPMCGVPYHAVDSYLNKLVEKGYKVGICEQVEDPSQAKGIVKREIVRIVTPGTNISQQSLDDEKNNYLMCIFANDGSYGISFVDVTTGDFRTTSMDSLAKVRDEIFKFEPAEIICNDAFLISGMDFDYLKDKMSIVISSIEPYHFDEEQAEERIKRQFKVGNLEGLGLLDHPMGVIATGALLGYLHETQKSSLDHLMHIEAYETSEFMIIDSSSRRNLELCETLRDKQKKGSLLWVLDKTKTAMGARMLRNMVEQPLVDKKKIEERYDAITTLTDQTIVREELREYLNPIYDLERLMTKVSYKTANPRDLIAFASSLEMLPYIKQVLKEFKTPLLQKIYEDMDSLEDVTDLIKRAIVEDPPLAQKDGGIIKEGYNEDVDKFRRSRTDGKKWLSELEAKERERTGIKTMKIKYNRVFGYSLEITNTFKDLVPDNYIRKQTLTNAERYITQELKELEDLILGAEDKLYALEYELFCDVRDAVGKEVMRIQKTAKAVAALDVFASLALVAERNHFVRPKTNTTGVIDIKNGRHPVVEQMIENDMFIANDTYLDNHKKRVSIITGPNMAGKSTYMRQTALIVLMAQIGSFVPAEKANIGIVDRIFTRVGASDDLASGQSTFMVEMTEVANILRNATARSLLILDEIGRGTSTFDGLAIAWAVIEHISNTKLCGAKTLFATHYHELTELEGKIPGVNNYCIAVKEKGDDIVFLRKIVQGGADKSYGIQVAKLAGVPDSVIQRAKELVEELSDADITAAVKDLTSAKKKKPVYDQMDMAQMSLFDTVKDNDIIDEIKGLDMGNMTPIEAMNTLYNLQNKIKNRW